MSTDFLINGLSEQCEVSLLSNLNLLKTRNSRPFGLNTCGHKKLFLNL